LLAAKRHFGASRDLCLHSVCNARTGAAHPHYPLVVRQCRAKVDGDSSLRIKATSCLSLIFGVANRLESARSTSFYRLSLWR
ncbi:hypothetical protein KCU81_g253, partial [Aureobasidium melanogenum]